MAEAKEHICRMRGGAQSHLMRCGYEHSKEESYFVVKFRNNPQHVRILANELLTAKLANYLLLPVPDAEEIEVSAELIAATPELRMELPGGAVPCAPGRQFGSKFPGDPRYVTVFDYVPDVTLDRLENLRDFYGMLVFDQWTCNTDGRQAVFVRDAKTRAYRAWMIDQGFCFNDGEWTFPDAPLRGLYLRRRVYLDVTGWKSFEPWLRRIEDLNTSVLNQIWGEIRPDWCGENPDELERLMEKLFERRRRVRELILAVRASSANPFPNWR